MKSPFVIKASRAGIRAVTLARAKRRAAKVSQDGAQRWQGIAEREIDNYFAGKLRSFSALCDLDGLPPFTRAVLKVTAQIPYGEVRSYRWIAEKLGKPGASRAVGNALAKNPIPIIIPCHRVVRSDGTIGGFALGTGWKRRLLELERNS
jgi:methylated-DNA-[protein]-cysteine S-methyltransferase